MSSDSRYHFLTEDGVSVDEKRLSTYLKRTKKELPFSQEPSNISRDRLNSRFQVDKDRFPFDPNYLGKTNPYTGVAIDSESDYDEYLREHAYHKLCDDITEAERSKAKCEIDKVRKTAEQDRSDLFRKLETERRGRKSGRRVFLIILVFAVLLGLLLGSCISKEGAADIQTRTSRARPVSAQTAVESQRSSESSAAGQDTYGETTGKHRDEPIANTYIGNKDSKKFHLPSCSYLPDKANQVTFDSREDAIAACYSPCGHCSP